MKLEIKETDGVPVTGIPDGSRIGIGDTHWNRVMLLFSSSVQKSWFEAVRYNVDLTLA